MAERVTTVGVNVVTTAIQESAAEHTRTINALMSAFVRRTTEHQKRFKLPGVGTLQPLDEWGNPLPVREEGYYDVAFPIQGGGTAWGDNRVARALMDVAYANRMTVEALRRDADWMRRHLLAAIFDNATWTYADPEYGDLTVQPLANGDSVTYVRTGGAASTDTHYLAQANAIDDSNNPYGTIHDELSEHPSNAGANIIAYIPTNLVAATEALTAFVEVGDPDIRYGSGVDTLAGTVDRGFGDEVLGKANKVWIVEWKFLPDNYIIAHAQGSTVLAMREYNATELQGFFTENHTPDGNLQETRMIRYAGFGAENRIAALVYRIGNGTYGIPTGYAAPLAV